MRYLLLFIAILIRLTTFAQVKGTDAGTTLTFSGPTLTNVVIQDAPIFDHPGNTITVEAWVYPTSFTGTPMIFSKSQTFNTREYEIFIQTNGILGFGVFDQFDNYYPTYTISVIPLNTWTHIACVYSYATGYSTIYLNGVQNATNNIGSIVLESTSINVLIGAYFQTLSNVNTRNNFVGNIDEVRLWHTERTVTQIRQYMCQILPTPQTNLICYYHLDEGSGLTAYDVSGNGNTGTLQNFPTSVTNSWPYSGAPVGDTSTYVYSPASWTGQSLYLPSLSNEGTMTINTIQGGPDGMQLFRVDNYPSQTGGLVHPINTYFGTFVVNGTSPTYTATYNYAGSIFDGFLCEPNYTLYQRTDNSVANWLPLSNTLNTTSKTLTAANIATREEIILDTACGTPLPVTFISLSACYTLSGTVNVQWQTAKEINNNYFVVERSEDMISFEPVGQVKSAGPSDNVIINYKFIDNTAKSGTPNYYRIKQVDLSDKYSYSSAVSVDQTSNTITVYPNPGNGIVHIAANSTIDVLDVYGNAIYHYVTTNKNSIVTMDLSFLPAAIYFIRVNTDSEVQTIKLVINK